MTWIGPGASIYPEKRNHGLVNNMKSMKRLSLKLESIERRAVRLIPHLKSLILKSLDHRRPYCQCSISNTLEILHDIIPPRITKSCTRRCTTHYLVDTLLYQKISSTFIIITAKWWNELHASVFLL